MTTIKAALGAAALACLLAWASPPARAAVLYSQPYDGVSPGSPSEVFTDTSPVNYTPFSTKSFDDFVVPGPGWIVNQVTIFGMEQGDPSQNTRLALQFQASSTPSFGDTTDTIFTTGTEDANGNLTFTLPNVFLAPRMYWITAWVVRAELPTGGQWFWDETTPVHGSEFFIQNPGGLLVPGATNAVPASQVFGPPPRDLAFTISGNVVPEPPSSVLMVLGMLGLVGCGRRLA
jgi:hypothetical protein